MMKCYLQAIFSEAMPSLYRLVTLPSQIPPWSYGDTYMVPSGPKGDLTTILPIAACDDIEPANLGAWPLRRCSKQAFMYRRCDMSQWHCKLL